MTLAAEGFDFRQSFPVPLDDARHRAGRQGVLDQKEDDTLSDAEWVAFQHRAWCDELCVHHVHRAYLLAHVERGVDPDTGKAPRDPRTWPAIEARARAEAARLDASLRAILGDYADHFGRTAADSFAAFVHASAQAWGDVGPAQCSLFEPEGSMS